MITCTQCGVQLDVGYSFCPLCGTNARITTKPGRGKRNPKATEVFRDARQEIRRHWWELSGILAILGIACCVIIDLIITANLSWSPFVLVSVVYVWSLYTAFYHLANKPAALVITSLVLMVATLLLFDLILPPLNWFNGLGLPLAISLHLCVGLVVLLANVAKTKGFNILALSLFGIAGFSITIDLFTDKYLTGEIHIRWSAIVAAVLISFSSILLFIQYRLKKGRRLNSYFHV